MKIVFSIGELQLAKIAFHNFDWSVEGESIYEKGGGSALFLNKFDTKRTYLFLYKYYIYYEIKSI